ncbi:hypothetical protein H6F90_12335 [Trichocoleus sp. FACHB-591]|uniref:hypothetical protein n=1 Tax=Trichocoleus sp. FACHB-591 TaxID=2692872 RepID=UPI001687F505|nr:hypothetical protein [Trichocoleus sp. FACHB-591]MBD2095936.1 hypothetical protein [Trichocoleus sp. FACHB-591]
MLDQPLITTEEQANVLAPFLTAAQAIAEINHRSVEAPRLKRDANKLIDQLQNAPAIAFGDLSELEQARLELVESLFESVTAWIESANSVTSIHEASDCFKSARSALKRTHRRLVDFIDQQKAYQKKQQRWAKRRTNAPVEQ